MTLDHLEPLDLLDPTDKMPLVTALDPRDPKVLLARTAPMVLLVNPDPLVTQATQETAVFALSTALLMVASSSRTASRK